MIMRLFFIRDALNASEHIIIFNCTEWPDLNNESAVMQFARVARKSGKQLIVAVREQDMKKMEAESGRIIKIH
ncbi:hypothetical protein ACNEV4_005030 [Escherichia coli]|nr:hypothetical protein [Salmonella enterica]